MNAKGYYRGAPPREKTVNRMAECKTRNGHVLDLRKLSEHKETPINQWEHGAPCF